MKDGIRRLNTNKTEKAVKKIGKTLGMLSPLLDNFDSVNNVKNNLACIIHQVCKGPGSHYRTFKEI